MGCGIANDLLGHFVVDVYGSIRLLASELLACPKRFLRLQLRLSVAEVVFPLLDVWTESLYVSGLWIRQGRHVANGVAVNTNKAMALNGIDGGVVGVGDEPATIPLKELNRANKADNRLERVDFDGLFLGDGRNSKLIIGFQFDLLTFVSTNRYDRACHLLAFPVLLVFGDEALRDNARNFWIVLR